MSDHTWDYPANAIEPSDCAPDRTYRVQFHDDDWDFDIPGDSPNQKVPVHQAKREMTEHGAEWIVTGAEDWTYHDDELVILGEDHSTETVVELGRHATLDQAASAEQHEITVEEVLAHASAAVSGVRHTDHPQNPGDSSVEPADHPDCENTVYMVKYGLYKGPSDDGPFTLIDEDGSGTWNDPATAINVAKAEIDSLSY